MHAYLANRVDVDVILRVSRVRNERLDQELAKNTVYYLDALILSSLARNPLLRFGPGLVEGQETALATTLDQLIWLRNELGARRQEPRVGGLCLVENASYGLALREM